MKIVEEEIGIEILRLISRIVTQISNNCYLKKSSYINNSKHTHPKVPMIRVDT